MDSCRVWGERRTNGLHASTTALESCLSEKAIGVFQQPA